MFFDGLGRPWWLAFLVTFVIGVILLRMYGYEGLAVGRIAIGVAGLVAFAVWLPLHRRYAEDPDSAGTRATRPQNRRKR